jgi:hypothetical protein
MAYADSVTLTLEGTGGVASGPGYVYPYYFSVNGSSTLTPLMCISFANDISFGESWTANIVPVAGNTAYEEAAYIFSPAYAAGASESTIIEAQWADWELFDPGAAGSVPSQYQSDVNSLIKQAELFVQKNPNASLYSHYQVYAPVDGSWPAGDGEPQFLIGDPPDVAPEPSSLVLLGSGLLGLAFFLYRRGRSAENPLHR